jgi:hypothetical protein
MGDHGMNQPKSESEVQERRTQARIRVQIPITLSLHLKEQPVTAVSQDLSWGGVLFTISEPLPKTIQSLRIVLPWRRQEHITADAQVLRTRQLLDGRHLVAARFASLSPRSQSRLERLLKMLKASASTADRAGPGELVRELDVIANDAEELHQMLEQIATGRHLVTVFDAYEVNQSICFSIEGTENLAGVRLRARVVEVKKAPVPGFDWAHLYTLALAFEHPRESIKTVTEQLLGQLSETRNASGQNLSEVPSDWLQVSTLVRSHQPQSPRSPAKIDSRCVLETQFPEALNYLLAGWGDVQAFEVMFRDLMLGDRAQPGGWPDDAWAELTLLQDVHDCAYGLSEQRRTFLKVGRSV